MTCNGKCNNLLRTEMATITPFFGSDFARLSTSMDEAYAVAIGPESEWDALEIGSERIVVSRERPYIGHIDLRKSIPVRPLKKFVPSSIILGQGVSDNAFEESISGRAQLQFWSKPPQWLPTKRAPLIVSKKYNDPDAVIADDTARVIARCCTRGRDEIHVRIYNQDSTHDLTWALYSVALDGVARAEEITPATFGTLSPSGQDQFVITAKYDAIFLTGQCATGGQTTDYCLKIEAYDR